MADAAYSGQMTPVRSAPGAGKPAPQVSLDTYKRLFREASDMTQSARLVAQKHRRYYDGKLDEKLRRELRRKRQPDFTINRVRPGVEGMIGVVDKGKSDPRAYPRTPQDQDVSDVATDSLRYVADTNRWHQNKLKVFRNILIEGTAAVLIEVDGQLEVKLRRIRFEEFFADPYSREPDFSDASYMGLAKWQYVDEIVSAYPEFEAQLRAACSRGDVGDSTWQDRPTFGSTTWADPQRKRMLIVEMYKRHNGTWLKCVFVGDLILEETVSPYNDNDDKPGNPIEAQSAYVDDENNRYGTVADMVGPQDEINVYRRKAAHYATFRQVQESDSTVAYADPDEVRREAARADGVMPAGYSVVPNDRFNMDLELLQEAKGEIERIGPNPAILGRQGADASGRATLVRQQAGLTELAHLFAGLDDLELRVYRQVWARIRQFWTAPKFIRVTDDDNSPRFVQVNEPVWGPAAPVMDPQTGMPQTDPVTRQIKMAPQFMGYKNAVAQMSVDIIVDTVPDTANVQQEQWQDLVELAKVGGLGPNPGPILIKSSTIYRKREILDELEQQQNQPPNPVQVQSQQLDLAGKQANVGLTQARANESSARAAKLAREASEPSQGQQPSGQTVDPNGNAKTLLELQEQQADTDKAFAQAHEARARAVAATLDAHQRMIDPLGLAMGNSQ